MSTATTLAAYGAALVVVFGTAVGIGNAVGPVGAGDPVQADHGEHDTDAGGEHATDGVAAVRPGPAGLAVSQDGYTLELERAPTAAGRPAPLVFRVLGPDGTALTRYALEHERELHLVLVRRDGTQFQHLHPGRDATGRWALPLTVPSAGSYKVFADFTPAGAEQGLTLATDLSVAGTVQRAVLPVQQRTAVVDGYTVTLDGDLVPGTASPLRLSVRRGGRPVTDLQPYLGAYGHLVALRSGDLAYLHVHPEGGPPAGPGGPDVRFDADVPSAGDYRLFLDFRHDGVVRTAAFGLHAPAAGSTSTGPATNDDEDGHEGHGT